MSDRTARMISVVLTGAGILFLLAAAFGIAPFLNHSFLFAALACLIIAAVVRKINKTGCGCK